MFRFRMACSHLYIQEIFQMIQSDFFHQHDLDNQRARRACFLVLPLQHYMGNQMKKGILRINKLTKGTLYDNDLKLYYF